MVPLLSPAVYVPAGRLLPLLTCVLIGLILRERDQPKPARDGESRSTNNHALTACRSIRSAIAAIESSSVKSKLISEKLIP
jgi:hypothetical protein